MSATREKMYCPLPDFVDAEDRVKAGTATALDRFIYEHEPAGTKGECDFRNALRDVLREERKGCALLVEEIYDTGQAGAHQGEMCNRVVAAILERGRQEGKR